MENGFVQQHISRTNRNLLVINLIVLLLTAWIAWGTSHYFSNLFRGPYAIPEQELMNITDPDKLDRYWVTVTGDKALDSGYQYVEREYDKHTKEVKRSTVQATYLWLIIKDRLLLVESPVKTRSLSFQGELTDIPLAQKDQIIGDLQKQVPGVSSHIIPAMLKVNDFSTFGWVGLAFLAGFAGLAGWNLRKAAVRNSEPELHPIMVNLANAQPNRDVREVVREVNTEAREPGVANVGNATITQSWLLIRWLLEMRAVNLKDLVWAYKHITSRFFFIIPLPPELKVIICHTGKKQFEIDMPSQKACDQFLLELNKKAPWAYIGFSEELKKAWTVHKDDMIAQVKEAQQPKPNRETASEQGDDQV